MTAPQFATFVAPATDGDTYSPKDNLNKPLIVKVKQRKDGIVTVHTPAPGGPGMIVDLVDLTDNRIYRDVLWMGGPCVDGLTPLVGQVTLIKFIDKIGNTGRHYPSPESASEYAPNATAYYQQHGDPFAPQFAEMQPATAPTPQPAAAPVPGSVPIAQALAPTAAQQAPVAQAPAVPGVDVSQFTPEQLAAIANLQQSGLVAQPQQ